MATFMDVPNKTESLKMTWVSISFTSVRLLEHSYQTPGINATLNWLLIMSWNIKPLSPQDKCFIKPSMISTS